MAVMVVESYKHSCPFCGQHIEYTAGYCGKQMTCPICSKVITFPAVPPRPKGQPPPPKPAPPSLISRLAAKLNEMLPAALEFKHWNIVLSCLIPFLIIAGLLLGARFIRKHFGEEPAAPAAPTVQAEAGAWQKLTEQGRAEQIVQEKVGEVNSAYAAMVAAQKTRDLRHAYYQGKPLDPVSAETVAKQFQADEQALATAQRNYEAKRQSFNAAYQDYQRLGGAVDYRRQLSQ